MKEQKQSHDLPHWNLENIFPKIDSQPFADAIKGLTEDIHALVSSMEAQGIERHARGPEEPEDIAPVLHDLLERLEVIWRMYGTLSAYLTGFISTDSFNTEAMKKKSELEMLSVRIQEIEIRFRGWLESSIQTADRLETVTMRNDYLGEHAFFLLENLEQARYQMSQPEETLAAELSLSGANAWSKLMGTVTSQLTVPFEVEGEMQDLPMTVLRNIRQSDPDETVRHQAFEAEIKAWESVREPLASCLNGVKGAVNTLNQRRGREDSLHSALDQARISRETLEAMLTVMQESFPAFRSYFKSKAKRLGKDALAFWDIFVGMGNVDRRFSFDQARDFIHDRLKDFSPRLADFTTHAIDRGWVDAEPRKGKRGGAFCMKVPLLEESRILMNFDGTLDELLTLAHELGHAFHNDCQKGLTMAQRQTPMTLAETASIFNETLITEAALASADDSQERLAILESNLVGTAQVVVDIYSRYLFESEVFERREQAELSADDFCEIMLRVQAETYGEGLDQDHRHAYMWAWKPHYYYAGLSYYNFPYAFGQLFGLGLYAIYKERGSDFVADYEHLLRSTGQGTAEELASRFDMDLTSPDFWRSSMRVIERRIEEYEAL